MIAGQTDRVLTLRIHLLRCSVSRGVYYICSYFSHHPASVLNDSRGISFVFFAVVSAGAPVSWLFYYSAVCALSHISKKNNAAVVVERKLWAGSGAGELELGWAGGGWCECYGDI